MHIVPTLLCKTKQELAAGMARWENYVDTVQIDFADGEFVPNRLPRPIEVNDIETSLHFECHLMVRQPQDWISVLLLNPQTASVLVHVESDVDIRAEAEKVHAAGRLFGVALRPETPLSVLESSLPLLDEVLLLGVNPGFNGSPFLPSVIEKVRQLRQIWPGGLIEVDGGINTETVAKVIAAGASQVAVGSFLQTGDPAAKIAELEAAALSRGA